MLSKCRLHLIAINSCMKLAEIFEGTWAIPDNQDKISILANLLRHPLTDKDEVINALYDVLGDDELADDLDAANAGDDLRPIIKKHLKRLVNDMQAGRWHDEPSEDVKDALELLAALK